MNTRHCRVSRVATLLVLFLAAVTLQGCDLPLDFADAFMLLVGAVPAKPEGERQVVRTLVQHFNSIAVPAGFGFIEGSFTPQSPGQDGADVAADTLPPTLRIILERGTTGQVFQSTTFNVALQPDGQIAPQSFPIAANTIGAGQQVVVSLEAHGANLPAGTLRVRFRYRPS
jgi:hypothetical protein